MVMEQINNQSRQTRIGFHYFPDTKHFSQRDLHKWLPELQALGASWLVLNSSINRAIPEYFINSLLDAGIEPIIRFDLPLGSYFDTSEIQPILDAYAHWGVNGVIFFDKPNSRSSWSNSGWMQQDLVEQFLEQYLPLATLAIEAGLIPIFPPLEPGGNYWDTIFLRLALESLVRREQDALLEKLTLSAYPWTHQHSLNWGAGGPDRWPQAKPYNSPDGEEDQRGFRIFDWYLSTAQAVLGRTCPILLLDAGIPTAPEYYFPENDKETNHASTNVSIIKLLYGEQTQDPLDTRLILEPLPIEVVSCNFWLLAADPQSPFYPQAWYGEDSINSELISDAKICYIAARKIMDKQRISRQKELATVQPRAIPQRMIGRNGLPQPIKHYLLLPKNEWGLAEWHLELIRPFVKKYQPTIGFSIQEAALSERVTVIGNTQIFPDEILDRLRHTGTIVERISGNGTTIATKLAER